MRTGTFVSFLFVAAICISFLSMQDVNSQSSVVTTTTTMNRPPMGSCSEISIAFSGRGGNEIYGMFGSNARISFYVLTAADFVTIQNPTCSLPPTSRPLCSELYVVGYDNDYRSVPLPADGTYYFVFVLLNSGVGQFTSGYVTVQLTFPASTVLIVSTTISSTIPSATQSTTQIASAVTAQTLGSTTVTVTNYSTVTVVSVSIQQQRSLAQTNTGILLTSSQRSTTTASFSSIDIVLVPSIIAIALAIFGVVRYRYSYRRRKEVSPPSLGDETVHRHNDFDERVYAYIKNQGGTISLSAASRHFGVPVTEIKDSIDRLKGEGRISF